MTERRKFTDVRAALVWTYNAGFLCSTIGFNKENLIDFSLHTLTVEGRIPPTGTLCSDRGPFPCQNGLVGCCSWLDVSQGSTYCFHLALSIFQLKESKQKIALRYAHCKNVSCLLRNQLTFKQCKASFREDILHTRPSNEFNIQTVAHFKRITYAIFFLGWHLCLQTLWLLFGQWHEPSVSGVFWVHLNILVLW